MIGKYLSRSQLGIIAIRGCIVFCVQTGYRCRARVRGHVFVVIVMIIIDKLDSDDVRLSSIITIKKIGQERRADTTSSVLIMNYHPESSSVRAIMLLTIIIEF